MLALYGLHSHLLVHVCGVAVLQANAHASRLAQLRQTHMIKGCLSTAAPSMTCTAKAGQGSTLRAARGNTRYSYQHKRAQPCRPT